MAHNKQPKNSLGFLVLTAGDEPMSFEEYKHIYGVDIDSLVYSYKDGLGNKHTLMKNDQSKVVMLVGTNWSDPLIPYVAPMLGMTEVDNSGDYDLILVSKYVIDDGALVADYGIRISLRDRIISAYER